MDRIKDITAKLVETKDWPEFGAGDTVGSAKSASATASRTADFISRRSPLLSRDRGDRGDVRRCGDRSCASRRSASSSVEQRRSS